MPISSSCYKEKSVQVSNFTCSTLMFLVLKACLMHFFLFVFLPCKHICVRVWSNCTVQRCPSLFPFWIVLKDSSHLVAEATSVEEVGPSTKSRLVVVWNDWMRLWSPEWKSGPENSRWKLNIKKKKETLELLFAELIAQCDGHVEIRHYGVTEDLKHHVHYIFRF